MACQLSPIARKQRQLAGLGFLGAAGTSVYSGPPVGAGAGKGSEIGAAQGASLGTSIMPGIGTAIGAAIGAIGGAIAGSIDKRDPENANFDQAVAMWNQNRLNVLNISNKYLPIAGLFDLNLKGPHIPIYQKYGRMGEERFTYDLATLIYNAAQAGKITASDTPQTVMSNVVQPWIDSWGYGPMQDPHADMINLLILGMITDYVTGAAPQIWRSIGGPLPASFSRIPPFQLPGSGPTTVSNAANIAPGSAVAAAPVSIITTPVTPVPGPVSTTATSGPSPTLPRSTVLTSEGASITAGRDSTAIALGDAAGNTFQLGPPTAGLGMLYLNGNLVGPTATGSTLRVHNGQVYLKPAAGSQWGTNSTTYTYVNGSWSSVTDPWLPGAASTAPSTSTTAAIPTTPTAVSIPSGFALVGTVNGLQAYVGPDGLYYSWSGAAMSPLTGVLTGTSGAVANVVSGQIQATPASSAQNIPQVYVPPQPDTSSYQPPIVQRSQAQAMTPGVSAPSTGLPTWAWLGVGAAAVYMLMGRRRHA